MMAAVLLYVPLLGTLNPAFVMLVLAFQQGTACIGIATISVVFAEYFPTKFRYSASGLSFAISNLIIGLMVSFMLPVIIASTGGILLSAPYVIVTVFAVVIVSLICILKLRETKGDKMAL
jgi:FtsH-binding integral membrane protein